MEATKKRNIRSGGEYNHLFPKAEGATSTIRKNANVTHTVEFIPKVVQETLHQTKALAQKLKGGTTYETCSNIWHFVYRHIAYKKDQEGFEQIRSPARAWHDRKEGVDCDCYSVFISSILTNLGIAHILRITKYHRDYFQHIYPVVPFNRTFIILDCVTESFDYEVPFSEKKDYPMDLQYLNGFNDDAMGELGKVLTKKLAAKGIGANKKSLPVQKKKGALINKVKAKKAAKTSLQNSGTAQPKKKGFFKKALNTVNKVNPATVLLRNGILASMKLNVKNVAKRLRWSYLTPEQAAQKGIDPQKFQRLIATRQKLEKIFYGAGGSVDNLRKAILGGKGNSDKAISGLDGSSFSGVEYMSAYTDLPQLLGADIYYGENVGGFNGLGQLGEPVTLASVGAAMGVLAGIVAALKQIGDIFPKKTKGSEDFDEKTNEAAESNVPVPGTTPIPVPEGGTALPALVEKQPIEEAFIKDPGTSATSNALIKSENNDYSMATAPIVPTNSISINEEETEHLPSTATNDNTGSSSLLTSSKESFWDKNKSWLKPVAIGVGGVSLIAIGFAVLKPKHTPNKPSHGASLSGLPRHKKKRPKRKSKKHTSKPSKKTAVALL